MRSRIFDLDNADQFGTWNDDTSRFMYDGAMPGLLAKLPFYPIVADYGGANGLMRKFFPGSIYQTIDIDASKNPSIVDDIVTHVGQYDLIVLRYVLHYLTDKQIARMFDNIRSYHNGDVLVIQFVNDGEDLRHKREISRLVTEDRQKIVRSTPELFALLHPFNILGVESVDYEVGADFYRNRLGITTPVSSHNERVYAVRCTP
jgi:hypothetical protein